MSDEGAKAEGMLVENAESFSKLRDLADDLRTVLEFERRVAEGEPNPSDRRREANKPILSE